MRESLDAIERRIGELIASGESCEAVADAELLAALIDGTLTLEQVDDEQLERCMSTFGRDVVVEALMQRSSASHHEQPFRPAQENDMNATSIDQHTEPILKITPATTTSTAKPSRWRIGPSLLALAASVLVMVGIAALLMKPPGPGGPTAAPVALQWPEQDAFDPARLDQWGVGRAPVAPGMPDFSQTPGVTLGTASNERITNWRMATVIVRVASGFGSGVFISGDGWILTNYHVIADAAQHAAVTGEPAAVDIITAQLVDGRLKPREPLRARIHRVHPGHDLALLKLEMLPDGVREMPHVELASEVDEGEGCIVIGSQHNGPAWWVRSGNVSQRFDYPEDLSQVAAGVPSVESMISRDRATVLVSDARVSQGDSGGPLLNEQGKLIGLTFATSANLSAGSVGWHIALQHLREFTREMPRQPEGVPFDPWTAALPRADMLEPALMDGDGDGRIDSLHYRFAQRSEEGAAQPAALVIFADLRQRSTAAESENPLDRVPAGLWGMEQRGRFRFDVFAVARADGVTAAGYTNDEGVVTEIRVGRSRGAAADVIWTRDANGVWSASRPSRATPLIDRERFSAQDQRRLYAITGQITGAAPADDARDGGGKFANPRGEKPSPTPEGDRPQQGPNRLRAE